MMKIKINEAIARFPFTRSSLMIEVESSRFLVRRGDFTRARQIEGGGVASWGRVIVGQGLADRRLKSLSLNLAEPKSPNQFAWPTPNRAHKIYHIRCPNLISSCTHSSTRSETSKTPSLNYKKKKKSNVGGLFGKTTEIVFQEACKSVTWFARSEACSV